MKKIPLLNSYVDRTTGIFFASFHESIRVDLEMARILVDSRLQETQGNQHSLVIDISNVREVTFEAREFLLRPDGGLKNLKAAAFVVSNPVAALIGNFFMKTEKNFPTRVFFNIEDASLWIQTLNQINL
jgi:hypothetical protein